MQHAAGRPAPPENRPPVGALRILRRRSGSPAAKLAWGAGIFLASQVALAVALSTCWPALRDPEYGRKLANLRRLVAAHPGRPLVLVLGSSRVAMGFRPDVLAEDARGPLVYNFSLVGSGPIMQLLCLDRLLDDGIRPDRVFIEYWPAFYNQDPVHAEECRVDVNRLGRRDLAVLGRYHSDPRALHRQWWEAQAVPALSHRFVLLNQWAPAWLPWTIRKDHEYNGLDGLGWLPWPFPPNPAQYPECVRAAWRQCAPRLGPGCLAPLSDRALRDLLALCRRQGIAAALVIMPEGSVFQSWYPPGLRAAVEDYLRRLGRECRVPVIDARAWAPDADFVDGFHLLPGGADHFTRRFGREVLQPLLAGRPSGSLLPEAPPVRAAGPTPAGRAGG